MKLFGFIEISISEIISWVKSIFKRQNKYNKTNTHILFVDDQIGDFSVIENLKEAGWSIEGITDIRNVDDDVVKRSQIIFIDYKGVGRTLSQSEQGIGLIRLLKKTYGKNKRIILYSAHDRFSLGDKLDVADDQLSKNSDTREFIDKINENMALLK